MRSGCKSCILESRFPVWTCCFTILWAAGRYTRTCECSQRCGHPHGTSTSNPWLPCLCRWHSSCAVCPDMFWFFSRKLGGQVLADTLLKPLNCSWWMPYEISWWVWHYWRCLPHPTATCGRGSKRTTFIHGLQGSFSVAGNARKGRTPMRCSGAPYLHDALGRLTDHRGTHTWACCPWQHPTAPRRSGLQHSVSATTELKLRGTFAGSTRKHDAPKMSRNRHLSMKRSVQEAQTGQS
jgi:hypothetical protein